MSRKTKARLSAEQRETVAAVRRRQAFRKTVHERNMAAGYIGRTKRKRRIPLASDDIETLLEILEDVCSG